MATQRETQEETTSINRTAQTQAPSTKATQPSIRPSAAGGLPKHARPADVLSLQRTVGNRAVQRMIQRRLPPRTPGAQPEPQAAVNLPPVAAQMLQQVAQQAQQLQALAYAQGNDIHLAPGQEQQLPHEAHHVVQQGQGVQLERENEE